MRIFNQNKPDSQNIDTKQEGSSPLGFKNHPFLIPVTAVMVLFFVSLAGFISMNGHTVGATDSRIVSVSVNGKQQIVPTRATTVRDLLERMNVEVTENDIIEPSIDTPIVDDNFKVNVYKARPISIEVDGKRKLTTVSAEPTATAVAEKAGVQVFPEDRIEKQAQVVEPSSIMREGLVAEKVVIERATPVNINLYGNNIAVRTHAKTVGDLLNEKDIKAVEGDTLQPSPDTPLAENTQVFVVRLGKQIDTKEEVIPVPVETLQDPAVVAGTTAVRQQGSEGKKLVTYEIEMRNGKESGRKVLQEVVSVEPVKKVVVKGVKIIISNPSENVKIGERMAAQRGWTGGQWQCLYQLWQKESHWNHLARNSSSGAYGIPQALPGSKMGSAGSDWATNPATQIAWGLDYIAGHKKYGTPCAAWNHSQAVGWY
ncbi:MAG: hypothetical protein JWL85_106 [Candidatus Saccharibacteria bacterium]|nr:hypothetical protein [Candidatus Saccharibacteria bacterium]